MCMQVTWAWPTWYHAPCCAILTYSHVSIPERADYDGRQVHWQPCTGLLANSFIKVPPLLGQGRGQVRSLGHAIPVPFHQALPVCALYGWWGCQGCSGESNAWWCSSFEPISLTHLLGCWCVCVWGGGVEGPVLFFPFHGKGMWSSEQGWALEDSTLLPIRPLLWKGWASCLPHGCSSPKGWECSNHMPLLGLHCCLIFFPVH